MKLDELTVELISRLEYEIGIHCYNANSYNGYTGEWGRSFRYPVQYNVDERETEKTKNNLPETLLAAQTASYQFGSNKLLIGEAIVSVLNILEHRYNLDFDKLEAEYQEKVRIEEIEKEKDYEYTESVVEHLKNRGFRILDFWSSEILAVKDREAYYINAARRIQNTDKAKIMEIAHYEKCPISTFEDEDIGDGTPDHIWNIVNFELPPEIEALAKEKNINIVYYDIEF